MPETYTSLMISRIPVVRGVDGYVTHPLWARDINVNADFVARLWLICPVTEQAENAQGERLDPRIEVVDAATLTSSALEDLVREADVVEIPGNFGWRHASVGRQAMKFARRHDTLSILGISSNRVKTTLMNAAGKGILARLKAAARAADIRFTQSFLARGCDAVRVVGRGIAPLVEKRARALHVDVASWIHERDIHADRDRQSDPVSIVIASRLEPMKGVSVGVEAVAMLAADGQDVGLNVIGAGEEAESLRRLAEERGLAARTRFPGQLGYPFPFFDELRAADYVLLTNLNDEQPRLVFDAIAQGAIPVCPRNPAYDDLGLPAEVFYAQGSSGSLAETLSMLITLPEAERRRIRDGLAALARDRTIETMHARRRDWVLGLLRSRIPTSAAG